MQTIADTVTTINDATLKFVAGVQERTLEANKTLAGLFNTQAAPLPSWLQFPESVSPEALVKQTFELGAKMLEADEKFALDLIDVWTTKPVAPKAAK